MDLNSDGRVGDGTGHRKHGFIAELMTTRALLILANNEALREINRFPRFLSFLFWKQKK